MRNYNANETLFKLIKEKYPLKESQLYFMKRMNLFSLINYYYNCEMETDKKIVDFCLNQKEKYQIFSNEITVISNEAYNSGLKLLFLKGLILAEDLFDPIFLRSSNDIDLYIDYSELEMMDNILRKLGYYVNNEDYYTNSLQSVKKYKSIRDELTHITPYHKDIQIDGKKFIIDIDLHIHFCHYFPQIEFTSSKSPFCNARSIKLCNGTEVLTLSYLDTVIHLAAHFIRHFYWEYFGFQRGHPHFELRIDLLYELKLYLDKHKSEIDYIKLLNRAVELNQLEVVFITLKIIDDIFGGYNKIVSTYKKLYLDKIDSGLNNGLSSRFIYAIINCDFKELLFKTDFELCDILYKLLTNDEKVIDVFKNKGMSISLAPVLFNKNLVEIIDINIIKKLNFDIRYLNLKSKIKWNEKEFILNIRVPKKIKEYKNYQFDKIMIAFSRKETGLPFDENLKFNDKNKFYSNNSQVLCFDSDKDNNTHSKFAINQNIQLNKNFLVKEEDDYFLAQIKIMWTDIKIKPIVGRVINVQFFVDFISNDDSECKYLRFTTTYGGKFQYSLYYPWTSEMFGIHLIEKRW